MSRVYFHSPSGTAELFGSERAHAAGLIGDMSFGIAGHDREAILSMVPSGHYLHAYADDPAWLQIFGTAWRVSDDLTFKWRDREMDAFTLSLNTALALGNDALRFFARMHGSCEIHGWVDGPDRAWLAGILRGGREGGIYRDGAGWESVIDLLEARADEPVVMSYSVCDGFPNPYASDWGKPQGDEDSEAWYELPPDEQWASSMRWLRARPSLLQIRPEDWLDFRFGEGLSALDLAAAGREERFAEALA
jgi:hypothetical protein